MGALPVKEYPFIRQPEYFQGPPSFYRSALNVKIRSYEISANIIACAKCNERCNAQERDFPQDVKCASDYDKNRIIEDPVSVVARHYSEFNIFAASLAKYVSIMSAPARFMDTSDSIIALPSSIQPF